MDFKKITIKKIADFCLFGSFIILTFAFIALASIDMWKPDMSAGSKAKAAGAITDKFWVGLGDGSLYSCDLTGNCVNNGIKGGFWLYAMAYFNNNLWLGSSNGLIQECDFNGYCTSKGNYGTGEIEALTVFNNKLWVGERDGSLYSCDTLGNCTSYGNKGNIYSMAVYSDKLWLGQAGGNLKSCDKSGNCTNYSLGNNFSADANKMLVYNERLWIGGSVYGGELGQSSSTLFSCNSQGSCSQYQVGNGHFIADMTIFNNRLWIIDAYNGTTAQNSRGNLLSCDYTGTCINYGAKAESLSDITVYNNTIILSAREMENFPSNYNKIFTCNTMGVCNEIETMPNPAYPIYTVFSLDEYNAINNISQVVCTDSDNGKNLFNSGTVAGLSADNKEVQYSDECFSGTNYGDNFEYVVEWSCSADGKHVVGDHFRCPNGCESGACREPSSSCTSQQADSFRCFYAGTSVNETVKSYSQKCIANLWQNIEQCQNVCIGGICKGGATGTPNTTATSTNSGGGSSGVGGNTNTEQTEKKVTICHVPPGNPENCKTIEVAESAAQALIKQGSYLGKCLVPATTTKNQVAPEAEIQPTNKKEDNEISEINKKAKKLKENKIEILLQEIKELRNVIAEQQSQKKYLTKLKEGLSEVSKDTELAITNFITYGVDDNTKNLGAGERAAVMYSYKKAFGKLPEDESDFSDSIKIANGRWPSETNKKAEKQAKEKFREIYKHVADMNNSKDNAAVTIIAYGLRQKANDRNLKSEKKAMETFKKIYSHNPNCTEEWNILQAITYSGATRGIDSDQDMLTDEQEMNFGTNPKNADTDNDGFADGIEVENEYNPKK